MPSDEYYLGIAKAVAAASKDKSHRVGAVLVGPEGEIRSTGYNGFPRGLDDTVEARHQRPAKYLWTIHAEQNALYQAARVGTTTKGCSLYVWVNASDLGVCAECSKAIIQCGIVKVVIPQLSTVCATWTDSVVTAAQMLGEAGVEVKYT